MYVIVDRLSSFDRFSVPFIESSYYLYAKSVIEIPDKLGIYLLDVLKKSNYSNSIATDMSYITACIYVSFSTIRRYFEENPDPSIFNKNIFNNTKFEYTFYIVIEEFFINNNFEYLYNNLNLKWIDVCSYIQNNIKVYYLNHFKNYENAW